MDCSSCTFSALKSLTRSSVPQPALVPHFVPPVATFLTANDTGATRSLAYSKHEIFAVAYDDTASAGSKYGRVHHLNGIALRINNVLMHDGIRAQEGLDSNGSSKVI